MLYMKSESHSVLSDCLQPHGLYIAHQTPLSMGFSRQEYWRELPFPSPGDLPHPGIESRSLSLADGFFTTEPVSGRQQQKGCRMYVNLVSQCRLKCEFRIKVVEHEKKEIVTLELYIQSCHLYLEFSWSSCFSFKDSTHLFRALVPAWMLFHSISVPPSAATSQLLLSYLLINFPNCTEQAPSSLATLNIFAVALTCYKTIYLCLSSLLSSSQCKFHENRFIFYYNSSSYSGVWLIVSNYCTHLLYRRMKTKNMKTTFLVQEFGR